MPGLAEPVEILVDEWGVPHLYAASQDDLFLAQGFNAARDRLRSHGLHYNLHDEVARALTLRDHGPAVEELRRRREPAPHRLRVPEGLDLSVIPDDVLDVYTLATTPPWAAVGPAPGTSRWR